MENIRYSSDSLPPVDYLGGRSKPQSSLWTPSSGNSSHPHQESAKDTPPAWFVGHTVQTVDKEDEAVRVRSPHRVLASFL